MSDYDTGRLDIGHEISQCQAAKRNQFEYVFRCLELPSAGYRQLITSPEDKEGLLLVGEVDYDHRTQWLSIVRNRARNQWHWAVLPDGPAAFCLAIPTPV